MPRMLKEFKKQQIMRRIEQDETIPKAYGFEAATRTQKGDLKKQSQSHLAPSTAVRLKKQSQFVPGTTAINPFTTVEYGDFSAAGEGENKANPPGLSMPTRNRRTSPGQFDAPPLPEKLLKSKKPPTEANDLPEKA